MTLLNKLGKMYSGNKILTRHGIFFKSILKSVMDKHAPFTEHKVRGCDCPWLTREIRSKIHERDYWLKKARKSGKEFDWSIYRRLRNAVSSSIRSSKSNFMRSTLRENINFPKNFWNQVKKCFPIKERKDSRSKVFVIDGETLSDKKVIADGFASYFANIGKNLQDNLLALINPIWKHHDHSMLASNLNPANCTFLFQRTNSIQIRNIVKRLGRSKVQGHDEIPTSLLIDGIDFITEPLSDLVNRCLESSLFPTSEKLSKIVPIYKADERSKMDHFRPISLLPVLSKVFEYVVHGQLYDYLEYNNLLSHSQFGFRKYSSTQHAVTLFSDDLRRNMDKDQMTAAVFVDLRKAFDTVDLARLLSKLPIYGNRNKELNWYDSYLFYRKHFVLFDCVKSDTRLVYYGVPQGSVLGPLLFPLLINDVELNLKYSQIILYGDDAVICYSDKNCENIQEHLNSDLELVGNWFSANNSVVNLKKSKTEYVMFGMHRKTSRSSKLDLKINGTQKTESNGYEYLGVYMDKNLSYREYLKKTLKKASSRVRMLSRIRQNIRPFTAEKICKIMVLPVMLYCNNVLLNLSDKYKQKFEDIQNRAKNIVTGSNSPPNWPSVNDIRNRRCIHEVFKCLHNIAPAAVHNRFTRSSLSKNTQGNNTNLSLPNVKTECGRKFLSYQGALIFNKLPDDMKMGHSLLHFKKKTNSISHDF